MKWFEFSRTDYRDIGIYFRIQANSIKQAWARMSWFVADPNKWTLTLEKDEKTHYLSFPGDDPYPISEDCLNSEVNPEQ